MVKNKICSSLSLCGLRSKRDYCKLANDWLRCNKFPFDKQYDTIITSFQA